MDTTSGPATILADAVPPAVVKDIKSIEQYGQSVSIFVIVCSVIQTPLTTVVYVAPAVKAPLISMQFGLVPTPATRPLKFIAERFEI